MSFCCQPSLCARGKVELLQLHSVGASTGAAWGNPGCPRFSTPHILAQKAMQQDLGTGHTVNAKHDVKWACASYRISSRLLSSGSANT